ncbi:unnamed protein product [Phaedon cochleariae]|uniref:Innexin n=1 Tax=Phaedon cochleariae TaxID=80249 RepID=A0A9N9X300_PHACE|nr:unnamed protein product [Phaedon cochleariae]
MIDFYQSLRTLLRLEKIHADNNVFKLHYKVTVVLLLGFSILLTSKQYFGEPINCHIGKTDISKDFIDTFCWISGTFTLKKTLNSKNLPGLGNPFDAKDSEIYRHFYYQWVSIAFGIQAIFFYVPKFLWKTWEAGRLRLLIGDLGGPLISDQWTSARKDTFVKYLVNGDCAHNIYMCRYCICEFLNFLNVCFQIYFMDWFISGHFSSFGLAYASYKDVNPMDIFFPKKAKCTYRNFGPSGSDEEHDFLCILPLNVLNEKLFLVLWYWLFILLAISSLCLLYRSLFLFAPKFRVYLLRAQCRKLEKKKAMLIVKKFTYGDFFILYKIGKNVDPTIYNEIVASIYAHFTMKGSCKNFPRDDEV